MLGFVHQVVVYCRLSLTGAVLINFAIREVGGRKINIETLDQLATSCSLNIDFGIEMHNETDTF